MYTVQNSCEVYSNLLFVQITVYEFTVEYCSFSSFSQNGSNVRSTLLVEYHCNFQCIVENTITNYVM